MNLSLVLAGLQDQRKNMRDYKFVSINRSTYLKGYSCAVILPL